MYVVTEKYTDFSGTERTEDFLFNMTKAELIKLELSFDGGFIGMLRVLIEKQNIKELIKVFDIIIDGSYGEKTPDGRGFKKSPEILSDFKATEAYSNIFLRFATDSKFASEFVNNIIPKDLAAEVAKLTDEEKKELIEGNVTSMPTA